MTDLTPEQIRSFLKDNVTVVAPGETLVIRTETLTPNQVRELADWLNSADLPFRTVVVPGEGMGVARAGSGEASG